MIATALDIEIAKAIERLQHGKRQNKFDSAEYIRKFEKSAKDKADEVLKILGNNSRFRDLKPIFLSIGGGDGAEIDTLLRRSSAEVGILIEGYPRIADMARERKGKLWRAKRKTLEVSQADAADTDVITEAVTEATRLLVDGKGDFIAVTCHAVIHELFDRGRTAFPPATFFGALFKNYEIPIWFTYREPGVPARWTDVVRVSAQCNPSSLRSLAEAIRLRHPSLKALEPAPAEVGECVRLHADLAMELLTKLFYLEDLEHEIEERVTAGKHFKLINELNRAMAVPEHVEVKKNVVTQDSPSSSFDEYYQKYKVKVLVDDGQVDLGVPQSHTRVIAWRTAGQPKMTAQGTSVGSEQLSTSALPSAVRVARPPDPSHLETQPFDLAVDGITVNSVGELIVEDPETGDIRRKCCTSYRRSLEDLAFAVVYGRRVLTSGDFRPSGTAPRQPGVELVAQLGEVAGVYELSPDLAQGALLWTEKGRTLIAEHIACAAECLTDANCRPFFREWMFRESKKYLGEDSTLFREDLPADAYKFNVAQPYYSNRALQDTFPEPATKALMRVLPKSPSKGGDPYAPRALREFVTRNVLSLVTIMLERDLNAERMLFWRMPHVLRGLIKRSYWKGRRDLDRGVVEQQQILRGIVVRHALVTAISKRPGNRKEVVKALLDLRDMPQFKETRELLQELGLLHLQPDAESEENAKAIVNALYYPGVPISSLDQLVLHRRFLVFRNLKETTVSEYERQLYKVFSELRPRGRSE